jgi:hypothetical protein
MQLAVVILSTQEGDYLRVSLPRTRRALPEAKIFVVTPIDDGESQAIATAMRAQTISVPKETYTKDDALFNYAALAKLGQEHAVNAIKGPCWIITTRAQICIDESINQIDLTSLDQEAVYGTGVKEVLSNANLITFKCEEPSSEEVRKLIPDSNFLMSFGHGPKFDAWSSNTTEAVTRYLNNFSSKYMIQKKLAHLGLLNADIDLRNTHRWGDPRSKVRIAPVHPATVEKSQPKDTPPTDTNTAKDANESKDSVKESNEQKDSAKDANTPKNTVDQKDVNAPKDANTAKDLTTPKDVNTPKDANAPKEEVKTNPTEELLKKEKTSVAEEPPAKESSFGNWKTSKFYKPPKPASSLEADDETSSKARSEPDAQQNVPLATASVSEKLNESSEEKVGKNISFGQKKFHSNPWKQISVE